MAEKKPTIPPTMAHDNHMPQVIKENHTPQVIKKNFVPQTSNVQTNHVPTTGGKPSTPPPNPKKK